MEKVFFEIINDIDLKIKCNLFVSETNSRRPIIIFSHGFKGFRQWGFIPYFCESLANSGFIAINIDFSMNGIIEEAKSYYDNDTFSNNTISRQVSDLELLINNIQENNIPAISDYLNNWNGQIHLIGHSLGGATSIIASQDLQNISSLTLIGTISQIERNTPRQVANWKEKGFMEVHIPSSGQTLHLNYSYWEDKVLNKDRFDLLKILSQTQIPVNIIHGLQDITVPVSEADNIFAAIPNENKSITKIPKCNHVLNTFHPFRGVSEQLEEAINSTTQFLKSYL